MKRFVAPAKCQLTFAVTIVMCIAPTVCQLTTQPVSFSGTTTAGKVRSDGRCGQRFVSPLTGVSPSECDPRSERPCCSDFGYCGASASHCKCRGCTDYRQLECYLRLEGEEGVLESPGYPSPYAASQDCKYDIVRTSSSVCGVRLYVEDMDIAGRDGVDFCTNDWFSVQSCVPEGGARLCGNESGTVYHYNFQPGATAIRLLFHSDATGSGRGFRIRYKLVNDCSSYFYSIRPSGIPNTGSASCFTRISESSGSINTPYHPKNYSENLDCVYRFTRSSPDVCGIRMASVKFQLQSAMETPFGGACMDFFQMPSCGFLCGNLEFSWFARYQPDASSLEFHFHSDESVGSAGFLISFEQVYDC